MRTRHIAIVAGFLGLAVGSLAGPAAAQYQPANSLTLYDQPDYRGASVTFYTDNANIGATGFASRAQSAQVRGTWRLCTGGGFRNHCEVLSANVRDLTAYDFAGRVGSAQLLSSGDGASYAPPPPADYGRAAPPAYAPPAADAPPPGSANPPAYDNRDRYAQDRDDTPAPAAAPYGRSYGAGAYPPAAGAPGRSYDLPPAPYAGPSYPAAARPEPPYPADEEDRGVEGRTAVFFDRPSVNGQDVSAWSPRAADDFCRAQGLGRAIYFDQGRRSAQAVGPDGRPVREGPVLSDVLCRK